MKRTTLLVSCLAATLAAQTPPMGPRTPQPPDVQSVPKQIGVAPQEGRIDRQRGGDRPYAEPAKPDLPVAESA